MSQTMKGKSLIHGEILGDTPITCHLELIFKFSWSFLAAHSWKESWLAKGREFDAKSVD